jgi:hypothetical protein
VLSWHWLSGLILLSFFSSALKADLIAEASRSSRWLRLYQYKSLAEIKYRSSVTAQRFFFADDGKINPEHEMRAAVEAYRSNRKLYGTQKLEAACVFPARKIVLERLLGTKFPDPPCSELKDWLKRLNADQVSLVYVGAYAGNPASILGHTFLRLSNRQREESGRAGMDLLSYSVGYMAYPEQHDNRMVYLLKGLTGGYPGFYEIEPHYMKVGLYNNSESRDLWDVKLKMSVAETSLLAMYFWELTFNSSFAYYFLDENCSYRLVQLLEAIKPDIEVSKKLGAVVLPAETVRKLIEAGAVEGSPRFRASVKRRIQYRINKMNRKQLASLSAARRSLVATKAITEVGVISALMDYWIFENYVKKGVLPPAERELMEATFTQAAGLHEIEPDLRDEEIRSQMDLKPPFEGHASHWVEAHSGLLNGAGGVGFSYRSGVHPLWSGDSAYAGVSAIEYLGLDVEWFLKNKTRWNVLLVDARSHEEFFGLDRNFSWMFDTKALNHCLLCETENPQLQVAGGAGVAHNFGPMRIYFFAHLQNQMWEKNGLQGFIAPGTLLGLKMVKGRRLTLLSEASMHWWKNLRSLDLSGRLNYAWNKNDNGFISVRSESLESRSADLEYIMGWARFF